METKKPSNPHAFPFSAEYGHPATCGGMTLRDYFASKALQGLLAKMVYAPSDISNYAEQSYLLADAMLKQREL